MKEKRPYRNLSPADLEELSLRDLRSAADNLRGAANALKDIGDFGPNVREGVEKVSETAKRVKAESGRRLRENRRA